MFAWRLSIIRTTSIVHTVILILCFAACQKIVKLKFKLATPAPVPCARPVPIPMVRSHAPQMQFAQHETALVNGDVSQNPMSTVISVPANSVVQVKCQLFTCTYFIYVTVNS